ncbi:hypothetical protein [Undibacterium flavidum]|uniref:Single cache domain-containing protein n=1 Tax=Undibacterium flavidum TaxID=2762297 RepID=A0ABR6YAK5_9BURK|nr:hypothetical protein [Undibacterium flavidum]MBC3873585.1 hypothetical protein [Undibacterium flavidum]
MTKIIIAILVVLLVATNTFWLYRQFNDHATDAFQSQQGYESANRQVAATVIASDAIRGKTKEEALTLLKRLFPDEMAFEKEGALHTRWLTFPLTPEGRVSGVAADPLAVAQSESQVHGTVGNEVFWPKK